MYLLKIAVIGSSHSGKTSIINRLYNNRFPPDSELSSTIGLDVVSVVEKYKEQWVKFQIWDTAGQERFRSIIPSIFKKCHLIMLVVDLTSISELDLHYQWKFICDNNHIAQPNFKILLVGNKSDISEKGDEICIKFSKEKKIPYIKISAKKSPDLRTKLLLDHVSEIIENINNNLDSIKLNISNTNKKINYFKNC